MRQFHEGISSKTFKNDQKVKLTPSGLIVASLFVLALSINI